MPIAPSPLLVFLALLAVQLLFGAGYVVSKELVGTFPPLVWASLRIVISTVLMLAFALTWGRKSPTGWKEFFKPLIAFALLGMIINQSSFLVGLRYTTSTNSAILNTLIPVFTLAVVSIRGQEKFTLSRGLGFLLALAGVLVLRNVEDFTLSNETLKGDFLTVLNCLSYAFFLSYSKPFLEKHDRVWTTTWLFVYGSIGISLLAIPDYLHFTWPEMTPLLWGCAVFAVLGTTLLTYFLNFWALSYAKSSSVALFIYLQPGIASLVAYFWKGEPITLRSFVASLLIFFGMLLGLRKA
ncbi:MAG: DMT family transporter [Oligoflexia bacterium]|jgi:drug/metabolite transporter (DMT)-like permease